MSMPHATLDNPVLVLNKYYTALRVISLKRAMTLLVKGAAEAVHVENGGFYSYDFAGWRELSEYRHEFERDQEAWLNCVSYAIAAPTVVRLLSYDRFRKERARFNRRNIFLRDKNQCQYCGGFFKTSDLNLDHVIPRSRGGEMSWENIVLSCVRCNSKKGARTPEEAGMKLIRKPRAMEYIEQAPKVRHESWKHFVDAAYWNTELRD